MADRARSARWLNVIGGVLLLVGVVSALLANHYATRVMGTAGYGVAVLAPPKDSPEWLAKVSVRAWADWWFWASLAMTAVGIALQTLAGLLATGTYAPMQPDKRSRLTGPVLIMILAMLVIGLGLVMWYDVTGQGYQSWFEPQPVLSLFGIAVGFTILIWQLGRQHANTLDANRRQSQDRLKLDLYNELAKRIEAARRSA